MATKAQNEADEQAMPELDTWRFDRPGKTLRGILTKIRTAHMTGINGEPFAYPLLFVKPDGVEVDVLVHAYPEVLVNELRSTKPMPGDPITIKYLGKKKTKANRDALIFEVETGGADAGYDWDNPGF